MPNFLEGKVWNKQSWNADTRSNDDNHESDLPFDEVTRIVAESVALFPDGKVPGEGGRYLDAFKAALQSADTTITVIKGIHQRNSKPHIRASIEFEGATLSYHVNLITADRITEGIDGSQLSKKLQRFVWRAAQVTVGVAPAPGKEKVYYQQPVGEAPKSSGGRARGMSFTQGQRVDHVNRTLEAQAERERIAKELREQAEKASKLLVAQAEQARLARLKLGQSPWGKAQ